MADHYRGPATLRTDGGLTLEVAVNLTTSTAHGTYSWHGRATTTDPRALGIRSGDLVLPDGDTGAVRVVHVEPDADGITLRLHGNGPAPY